MELHNDKIQDFFTWMNERHAIYLRRQRGDPWPWTNDHILQIYKFTNVYRELDAGTQWCREHIIEPYRDDPELFFNIAMYRRYNWIGTQQLLGYIHEYDADITTKIMLDARNKGIHVFTGAHMLCGNIKDDNGYLPPTKVEQVFGISFKRLWEHRHELEPKPGDTLEVAFNRLNGKVPGYGAFITYEVITDLRHTRYLNAASDIMTWANVGPGARRGVMRLMGIPIKQSNGQKAPNKLGLLAVMKWLLDNSQPYLASWMDPLEMRDIEHSLCEWDKYQRVLNGEGKPRSLFTPPNLRR